MFVRRHFHAIIVCLLLVCLICPFVELLCNSNGNIFQTGQDTETTVAVVLLLLELLFLIPLLCVFFVFGTLHIVDCSAGEPRRSLCPSFGIHPDLPPPIPLRI